MAAHSSPAVSCQGITKAYGQGDMRMTVLDGVDMTVSAGELTLLTGPSGSGKTTLISIISGLLSADSGSIDLFDTSISAMPKHELPNLRSRMVGFVFQQFNLLPALTAIENVCVPLTLIGINRREACQRASEGLEQLGLAQHKHKLPAELSGGQQQRVAIARALVHKPRLIICDEPTASLDVESGHNVMQILRDIAVGSERAVIIVTHDSRHYAFADRIFSMAGGRIVASRTCDPQKEHRG